jgi:hypothetical protein
MINKGKLVFCKETFQIFPSAKAASEHHNIHYATVAKHLEGKIATAKGKHFVYIENTADLSNFFSANRQVEKERKAAEAKIAELTKAKNDIVKELAAAHKILKKLG